MKEEQKGNIWLSLATFIVNKRKAIMLLFAVALIFCAVSSGWTKTNSDITAYLPATSETRIGLDAMDREFVTFGSARVMISNITFDEAEALLPEIEAIEGVKEVTFDDSSDHFQGTNALYSVTFEGDEESDISLQAMSDLRTLLDGRDFYISSSVGSEQRMMDSLNQDIRLILVLVVIIIVAVLLLSTKAFMEIPVLLITFGSAALLNKGTNFLMGTISSVTDSIAVILQLALAIDYAIIFCDRFMEEHETMDAESAVKVALSKAIPEISASSLTTVSGMVAMMFMQFRLGYDMGIVLVKAILLSLVAVFFLMPGVLLIFAKGIDKTHHRSYVPNITFAGRFANLTKYVIPPLFVVLIGLAFYTSYHCQYIYDTDSVPSASLSEDRIAENKIDAVFGEANQLVVMVPAGDYEKEKVVLGELKDLPYVKSALGLAGVSINDQYVLTDKINPRAFSELAGLDVEVARFLYIAYAYGNDQYGPVFTGIDDYEVPIIDMFLFLYDQYQQGYVNLDEDLSDTLTDLYSQLHDAKIQLQGENYSRFVLDLSLPSEGDETYAAMDEIRTIAENEYGSGTVLLVGDSTSCADLKSTFSRDNLIISVLTALFVMIILLFTFQSAGLPVLLVLTIQGSIWINFSVPPVQGEPVFFIAYLIVSAIQMGATIDYAIVISSRYLVLKKELPLKQAIIETLNQAFPTIFTSGTILVSAGFLIGRIASFATVASIGTALGRGALVSIILVIFVLPQILLFGDFIIEKTALAIRIGNAGQTRQLAGLVIMSGRVKGYVQGEIDAEITGTFRGSLNAALDAGTYRSSGLPGDEGVNTDAEGASDSGNMNIGPADRSPEGGAAESDGELTVIEDLIEDAEAVSAEGGNDHEEN